MRPTFLTVLCVLTFIGSGFGIYSAITNYTSAEMASGMTKEIMDETRDKLEEETDGEPGAEVVTKIIDSVSSNINVATIKNNALASSVSNILTLIGAVLMWGLNKKGFFIYLIGAAVGVLAPFVIYDGIMAAITSGGTAFFSVIMCVLYYLNAKHLS
jgi:hypothetical protein